MLYMLLMEMEEDMMMVLFGIGEQLTKGGKIIIDKSCLYKLCIL